MADETTRTHRDLIVWQRAMELVDDVYRLAGKLPDAERFGLYSQLTRAAVSVPANIAEGHGRSGGREFANFVSIARGSLAEVDTLLEICARRGYASPADYDQAMTKADEVGRMLTVLLKRLRHPNP